MTNPPGPPRFVPTLTDIVQLPVQDMSRPVEPLPQNGLAQQEQVVNRVMRRLDLMLDKRLREALGQVILEQTQNLVPLLRQEIEQIVYESVSQAMAQEQL